MLDHVRIGIASRLVLAMYIVIDVRLGATHEPLYGQSRDGVVNHRAERTQLKYLRMSWFWVM